jgi:hypothetical protein
MRQNALRDFVAIFGNQALSFGRQASLLLRKPCAALNAVEDSYATEDGT